MHNPQESATKPSQLEYEAVAALRTALRHFLRQSDRITRVHGLTAQRYDLLAVIKGSESAVSISELAQSLSLALHSVSGLVDRAEQAGLLRRWQDEHDRRVTRVTLTAAGERRLAAAVTALRPERRLLFDLLAKVDTEQNQVEDDLLRAARNP